MHYYAQKKTIKDGAAVTPTNYSYADRVLAERQFYLLCANAITNGDACDMVSVEYGTIETGVIERRFWQFATEPETPETPDEEQPAE